MSILEFVPFTLFLLSSFTVGLPQHSLASLTRADPLFDRTSRARPTKGGRGADVGGTTPERRGKRVRERDREPQGLSPQALLLDWTRARVDRAGDLRLTVTLEAEVSRHPAREVPDERHSLMTMVRTQQRLSYTRYTPSRRSARTRRPERSTMHYLF